MVNLGAEFWDALAPHHAAIENTNLDLNSIRRVLPELQPPILVVGAGHGLIVGELIRNGLACDGVDRSEPMIEYARQRRGLKVIHADARALPFTAASYRTIIYATGVIDFIGEDELIGAILNEARRVVAAEGKIFIGFYRISPGMEQFMTQLGLLRDHVLAYREILGVYRLPPLQAITWFARKAGVSYFRALTMALRSWLAATATERKTARHMQRIFANPEQAEALLQAAPEKLPYRNRAEAERLFQRLAIPILRLKATPSCHLVRI